MSAPGEQDSELGETSRVAVVVAHPDDETLWAGGLLLSHPEWSPFIVTLCRGRDPERAPRFLRALERLSAKGTMGDLDDGPDQVPLPATMVQDAILSLLPGRDYDILLTHAPDGEYTRHRRHEEVSRAVWALWRDGNLRARRLWQFAYEDGGGAYFPRPRKERRLPPAFPCLTRFGPENSASSPRSMDSARPVGKPRWCRARRPSVASVNRNESIGRMDMIGY